MENETTTMHERYGEPTAVPLDVQHDGVDWQKPAEEKRQRIMQPKWLRKNGQLWKESADQVLRKKRSRKTT